jgi:hypothetical protein
MSLFGGLRSIATNGLYWRRSGLLPLKLIRSTTVDATTNVHTKHRNRFFANTLLVADADF